MTAPARRRELGRGERVVPGVSRLRLPLPWPGVPHCNAWALAAGDGVVLVDTGMHEPGSLAQLERAMEMVDLKLEHVRLLICTHAHADHCGQAAAIVERTGCELWMHPNHAHLTAQVADPEQALARRLEVARQSGVPEEPLRRWAASRASGELPISGLPRPDRELVPGVTVQTDLGAWTVHETPGHAPSHVCLHQREQGMLISGDHLLGRVALYFDYGYSPDPVGEYLRSLDVVDALDGRLALAGHGRPFRDVRAHVEANRALVRQRLHAVRTSIAETPLTGFELAERVYGPLFRPETAGWLLTKMLAYLSHLELEGAARREPGGEGGTPDRWAAVPAG